MGIKLSINKRHSLEGLAEGWTDDCYLLVKSATVDELTRWTSEKLDELAGDAAYEKLIGILVPKVISGRVLSQTESGEELVNFKADEAEEVLRALPMPILNEIIETSVGLDKQRPIASPTTSATT